MAASLTPPVCTGPRAVAAALSAATMTSTCSETGEGSWEAAGGEGVEHSQGASERAGLLTSIWQGSTSQR